MVLKYGTIPKTKFIFIELYVLYLRLFAIKTREPQIANQHICPIPETAALNSLLNSHRQQLPLNKPSFHYYLVISARIY